MNDGEMPPVPELLPPIWDRTADSDAREWVVVECIDASRDETDHPGERKVPVIDLAMLRTRAEAWAELHGWLHRFLVRGFSMRRGSNVGPAIEAITRTDDDDAT